MSEPAKVYDQRFDFGTTTSTAYTYDLTGAIGCEVVFTAPDDGAVWIKSECELTSSSGDFAMHSIEIQDKRGGIAVGASDDQTYVMTSGPSADKMSARLRFPVAGLNPGWQYKARQMFRVSGGTGTVGPRKLEVLI